MLTTGSAGTKPVTTTITLRFPAPLYAKIRLLAEARHKTLREVMRQTFAHAIEQACRAGEVGGKLFEGPIGQDPFDLRPPDHAWSSLGRTQSSGGPETAYLLRLSRRFWQQIKGLAVARRQYMTALAIDLLTREVERALRVDGKHVTRLR
jgi:hypothetical protein